MQLDFSQHPSTATRNIDDIDQPLVGASAPMRVVHSLIAKLANNNATVLITGESATGKELAARAIHEWSARRAIALDSLRVFVARLIYVAADH